MANSDRTLELNDIEAARRDGRPVYEVRSGGVTLEMSPHLATVKKAVENALACTVWEHVAGDSKKVVLFRCNKQTIFNYTPMSFGG